MKRLITLTYQYYRLLLFNNVLFSIMCGTLIYLGFDGLNAGVILFAKLIGFACAVSYHYYRYSNSYYYFRNAGLTDHQYYNILDVSDRIMIINNGCTKHITNPDELITYGYLSGKIILN